MNADRRRRCDRLAFALAFFFMAPAADGQLYRPEGDRTGHGQRVVTWLQPAAAVPLATIDGDDVLTAWGPNIVNTPGLALSRCSTGETLWTLTAESGEWLTGYLLEEHVLLSRFVPGADTAELQWLDRTSGEVQHVETIAHDSNSTILRLHKTVLFAGRNEVFDLRTGQRRGTLPEELSYLNAFESQGKLYGGWSPTATAPGEYVEIDLESLKISRRWNLQPQFQERGLANHFRPILCERQMLVLLLSIGAGQPSVPMTRTVVAVDLEQGQIVWQTEVPAFAPLLFADDLSALRGDEPLPPDLTERPLILDLRTGEHRLGQRPLEHADLIHWGTQVPAHLQGIRVVDDVTVFHLVREGDDLLTGLDPIGRPVWSFTETMLGSITGGDGTPSTIRLGERYATNSRFASLDIIDLRTGQVVHTLKPNSVGLVARAVSPAATAGSPASSPATQTAEAALEWLDTWTVVLCCVLFALGAYFGVRKLTHLAGHKSPMESK